MGDRRPRAECGGIPLKFSVRGWNGDGAAVLGDARWAIDEIARAHPGLAIVVVGHSLGGRVAIHVVGSVVPRRFFRCPVQWSSAPWGLAPWVDPADPVELLRDVPLAVVQGTRDRIVPEPSTRAWLARAARWGAGSIRR